MKLYKTIGVMSGTSLDGIDIAYVEFMKENYKWQFQLGPYASIAYSDKWKSTLQNLPKSSALKYAQTHVRYGHYIGHTVASFIQSKKLEVGVIGSHGHTVFHQPENGFTSQIGDGSAIATETGLTVVCDFRSMDLAKGGQGAPLVPIGDALLFGTYKARVNLGGFSNISIGSVDSLQAFDICPVNIILNDLTKKLGYEYDNDGTIARGGQLIPDLLVKLNQLKYYKQKGPKSLGVEWLEREIHPLLTSSQKVKNLLRTFVEHAAFQISNTLNSYCSKSDQVLFTGGGVFNSFLMERIIELTNAQVEIPSSEIIEMKEAIIFAFLGLLRFLGEENILSSYSGAKNNSVSGAIYIP